MKLIPAAENTLPPTQKYALFCSMFTGVLLISFSLNNDIWFLLNGGRYVLTHGLPFTEPFTLHPELKFVMQQWLTNTIFWSVYQSWGGAGLIALVGCVHVAILFTVYRLCLLVSGENFRVAVLLTTGIGIFSSVFMHTRPQIFSALLLLLVLFCLERFAQKQRARSLLWLPLLSVLLINLHAALWPMLFVLALPYLIDAYAFRCGYLRGAGYAKTPLWFCVALTAAAGFLNPYGWDAMTYLYHSYGYDAIQAYVGEMKPLNIISIIGKTAFATICLPFVCYCRAKEPLNLRYLLLSLGLAYLAMVSIRGLFLFWLCGLFPLAYVFRRCTPLQTQNSASPTPREQRLQKILLLLLALLLSFLCYKHGTVISEKIHNFSLLEGLLFSSVLLLPPLAFIGRNYRINHSESTSVRPYARLLPSALILLTSVTVGTALLASGVVLKVSDEPLAKPAIDHLLKDTPPDSIVCWTNYNDGDYVEFRGIPAYIDARAEVFLQSNNEQKDIFMEYLALESGALHYREFIQRYAFTHFLTKKSNLLYTYLYNDSDYELIFEDDAYRLYKKLR